MRNVGRQDICLSTYGKNFGGSEADKGKRTKSKGLIKVLGETENEGGEPEVVEVTGPVRRAQGPRIVAPGAALDHTPAAFSTVLFLPGSSVRRRSIVVFAPAVFDPFPHIATHIIQ